MFSPAREVFDKISGCAGWFFVTFPKNIYSIRKCQKIISVCKGLRFFELTACIFCDPSKHKKCGSMKLK